MPPPGFTGYDYRTPPQTPPYAGGTQFYSRHYSYTAPAPKGHARRATGDGTAYMYSSNPTTPRKSYGYAPPDQAYYSAGPTKSARKPDYVSNSERVRESTRTFRVPTDKYGGFGRDYYPGYEHHSSPSRHYGGDDYHYGRSDEFLPRYEQHEPRPPPYNRYQSYREPPTDHRYYGQERIYTPAEPNQTRPRRASYTAQYSSRPSEPRRETKEQERPRTATKEKRTATAADAVRAGIPAGFSTKFWDPNEEPILLLGSVFDADSLGKWIYDWAAFFYGAASPLAEEAGDLWVLLINLSHKIKLAEEVMGRVRSQASRDLLDEFLESGERIWQRFSKLLKICESYMWNAAKKESGSAKKVSMGKNSGLAFVEAMFDRDCELRTTEKLMQHIRTWLVRYDANCLPILKDPSA